MAIDMSTVKAITHNNKDVTMIQDSHGNVLWRKSAKVLRKGTITLNFAASGTTYPTYTIVTSSSTSPYTSYIRLPSINSIKSQIEAATGISTSDINSITSAIVTFCSRQARLTNATPHVYITNNFSSSSITSSLPGTVISDVNVTGNPYEERLFNTPDVKSYLNTSSYRTLYLYKGIITGSSKSYSRILSTASSNEYGYSFNNSGSKRWTMTIDYTYYADAYYIKYNGYYMNVSETSIVASTTRTTTWSVDGDNHVFTEINGVNYYLGANNTGRAAIYTTPTGGSSEVFGTTNSYIYYVSSYGYTKRLRYYSNQWLFSEGNYTVTWEQ